MSERVELPGGAWAQLRDVDAVTERQRKPFITAIGRVSKMDGMDDGGIGAVVEVQDALITAMVEAWSFELAIDTDSLLDLPHRTVTALRNACGRFRDDLIPDFGASPDPQTPTEPSSA